MNGRPDNPNHIKIDGEATARLLGAALKGFLFGEAADPQETPFERDSEPPPANPPQATKQHNPASRVPSDPFYRAATTDVDYKSNQTPQPTPPPEQVSEKGVVRSVRAAAIAYNKVGDRVISDNPQFDRLAEAFRQFNAVGLSVSEATLFIGVLRANLVLTWGVGQQALDYTLDAAVDAVDEVNAQPVSSG